LLVPFITLIFVGAFAKHRLFDRTTQSGTLSTKQMGEISGISSSSINPDIYYVHNKYQD